MSLGATIFILLCFVGHIISAPALDLTGTIFKGQDASILTTAQIAAFRPLTYFASAAYCQPASTLAWNCGAKCLANPDFMPTASGGNGSTVQFWYVGYSPSEASVIVAHQGTDTEEIEAILTDLDIAMTNLDPTDFPGVSPIVRVHRGFYEAHARTSRTILAAVQRTIAEHRARRVITTGFSLGAALALLDGVFLPLHINGVTFETVTYGLPRVGNQDFANYVDGHLNLTHINNKKDIIPILPGRFLKYHHPAGEIHIMENNEWARCPGQDNPSSQCTVGDVPNILEGRPSDHSGPYDGITIDC